MAESVTMPTNDDFQRWIRALSLRIAEEEASLSYDCAIAPEPEGDDPGPYYERAMFICSMVAARNALKALVYDDEQ